MKKTLLLLTFVSLGIFQANAQCTIAPSCTPDAFIGSCVSPDQGTALPNGEVDVAYTTVIQVSVGNTAAGGSATVDNVEITNIVLPAGLTYTTNPANGIIPGGQNGCIEIAGTPTTAGTDQTVTVQVIVHSSIDVPLDLGYTLTIDQGTASLKEVVSANLFSLFPNPATSDLTVKVTKPMEIEIFNVLGTKVLSESIKTSKTINIANLNAGVYFVIDKETGTTQKLIKR